jgi:hypothetical protein
MGSLKFTGGRRGSTGAEHRAAGEKVLTTTHQQAWRVMCQTRHHPGQWQTWFREQCCAVGWHPSKWKNQVHREGGFHFDKSVPSESRAWSAARNTLSRMQAGDLIAALLPGGRLARIGEIVRCEVEDHQWNPVVRPSNSMPFGENGRRILVRWDLSVGPTDPGMVVALPQGLRDNGQHAVSETTIQHIKRFRQASENHASWEPFHGNFKFEHALSDYIAMHPHELEDGLITHSSAPKVREWTVSPGNRIDVVLEDPNGATVLVECKQNGPTVACVDQLSRYMREVGRKHPLWGRTRGILVHGGSRKVSEAVAQAARRHDVQLVHHALRVSFSLIS